MRRLLSLFLLIALLAGCSAAPDLPGGTPLPSQTDTPSDTNATAVPGDGESVTVSYAVWDYEQPLYEPAVALLRCCGVGFAHRTTVPVCRSRA